MCNERRRVVGRESWPTGYDEQNNQDVKCAARRAALQWRHFAYARHGVPCLELARAELRPTPAPPVPTAEEVAEAAAAEAAEAAWEEARAARQMEADLRLSREWLLGLDDDCVDDDYR